MMLTHIIILLIHTFFLSSFILQFGSLRSRIKQLAFISSISWLFLEFAYLLGEDSFASSPLLAKGNVFEALRLAALFGYLAVLLCFYHKEQVKKKESALMKLPFLGLLGGYFENASFSWVAPGLLCISLLLAVRLVFKFMQQYRLIARYGSFFLVFYSFGYALESLSFSVYSQLLYAVSFIFFYQVLNLILVGNLLQKRLNFS